jgi:hypothetical protein
MAPTSPVRLRSCLPRVHGRVALGARRRQGPSFFSPMGCRLLRRPVPTAVFARSSTLGEAKIHPTGYVPTTSQSSAGTRPTPRPYLGTGHILTPVIHLTPPSTARPQTSLHAPARSPFWSSLELPVTGGQASAASHPLLPILFILLLAPIIAPVASMSYTAPGSRETSSHARRMRRRYDVRDGRPSHHIPCPLSGIPSSDTLKYAPYLSYLLPHCRSHGRVREAP